MSSFSTMVSEASWRVVAAGAAGLASASLALVATSVVLGDRVGDVGGLALLEGSGLVAGAVPNPWRHQKEIQFGSDSLFNLL